MQIITRELRLNTKGNPDLLDITSQIEEALDETGLREGNLTVFVIGSTAAITTFEFEPGLNADIREMFEKLIPSKSNYRHDQTWGDANGFSHLRASLQGPSLVIPFKEARLFLGTWQQVVLAEFDNRPRERSVILQFLGE